MPETLTREGGELFARLAPLVPSTIDEATRSVEAVIATEAPIVSTNLHTRETVLEVLRMDGAELPEQIPLLDAHQRASVHQQLGSIRNLRIDGDRVVGRLYVSAAEEGTWTKIKEGHIRDVSIGHAPLARTVVRSGEAGTVKGRSYQAPRNRDLNVNTGWLAREASVLPIGADPSAKIRSFEPETPAMAEATNAAGQAITNNDAPAGDAEAARAAVDTAGQAGSGTQHGQEARGTPSAEAIRAEVREQELVRTRAINELAGDDVPREMVTRALNEGWDVNRSSREFLTAVRGGRRPEGGHGRETGPNHGGPGIHSRSHDVDVSVRTLASAMVVSQGVDPTTARLHDGRRTGAAFTPQEIELGERFSRLSAVDICRECVRLDTGRHVLDPEDAVREAVSGASFSYVFSTNVYARLLQGWQEEGDTTTGWCDEEDVANFMQQEDISLEANAALEKLPRGDTAKHATASDKHETYSIARYAKKFVVDEQDIIDDRLGAIMRMPMEMGQAARRLRPDLVYSLLLENPNLVADSGAVFNATAVTTAGGHKNLTTAVLSSTSLKAAISAMVKQRLRRTANDPGQQLMIRPKFLIVPADLEWLARELTAAAALAKLFADSSDPFYAQLNLLASEGLRVVPDDRVGAIGVMDPRSKTVRTGLDTNWFLTSGGSRGLRVAYRRGTGRSPQMRSFQLDRGQWGIGWDINMDLGAAFMDFRTWHKSTGAG